MKENRPPKPESGYPSRQRRGVDADTIAAVATAPGVGGIGVVRVSGERARALGEALCGRRLAPRHATYARFRDAAGTILDAGIALFFPAPGSFTGEDVVEFQGHGGPVVLHLLLEALLSGGARLARPGEFTERAFVNGKLDLAQAEAVADLIASVSAAAARGAVRSLTGDFSRRVDAIDQQVLALRVYVEAAMDFPEEGEDFLAEGQVPERMAAIAADLTTLRGDARQGVLLRDGIALALVGAPNVGKSSLLNRLAGQDRAIVTEIPGTTRDLIHADLSLDGLPVQLVDTAGLREAADVVEQEGVRRARAEACRADLVLLVEDDRQPLTSDAGGLFAELVEAGVDPGRILRVRNKADLSSAAPGAVALTGSGSAVRISALTGAGVDTLVGEVKARVGFAGEGTGFTARQRHIEALREAATALEEARAELAAGAPAELVAEALRGVHLALGRIVGAVSADELLGEIFSSFCIGK